MPPVGVFLYQANGAVLDASPFLNESYFTADFDFCTATRAPDLSGTTYNRTLLILNETSQAVNSTITLPNMTYSSQCSQLGRRIADGGLFNKAGASLRGSQDGREFHFVRVRFRVCSDGNMTVYNGSAAEPNNSFNVTCVSDVEDLLKGSEIVVIVGHAVPPDLILLHDRQDLRFNTSYSFPYDAQLTLSSELLLQRQSYEALPSYFGGSDVYNFPLAHSFRSVYMSSGAPLAAEITVGLHPQQKLVKLKPLTLLSVIGKFGQVVAAMAFLSIIIRRINFFWFYVKATDNYFVPDVTTRKFLLANRKHRVRDYESQLMYALTFGMTDRFGLQSKHIYEYFRSPAQQSDRRLTLMVVEDIQRFMLSKRIAKTIDIQRPVGEAADGEFDVATVTSPALMKQSVAKVGHGLLDDDEEMLSDPRTQMVREVETSLRLCVLQDELAKMKTIVALLFPTQARNKHLAERLQSSGVRKSAR